MSCTNLTKRYVAKIFFCLIALIFGILSCKKDNELNIDNIIGTYLYHESGAVSIKVEKIDVATDEVLLTNNDGRKFVIQLAKLDEHTIAFNSGEYVYPIVYTTGQGCSSCPPTMCALKKVQVFGKFLNYNEWIEIYETTLHKEATGDWLLLYEETYYKMHL